MYLAYEPLDRLDDKTKLVSIGAGWVGARVFRVGWVGADKQHCSGCDV